MLSVDRMQELFDTVARDGLTSAEAIRERIAMSGIGIDDFRLRTTRAGLEAQGDRPIDLATFTAIVGEELRMVSRIFRGQLVIPDWQEFRHAIRLIHEQVAADRGGANADYIPILRDADPERWGVALCSVDGQRLSFGDVDIYHSIQSVSKPLTYAYALDREGAEFTHSFVGVEPSGRPFNALDLLPDQRPFNPCVNAGAIMTAGVVASGSPDKSARRIMDLWSALCGSVAEVRFSEETMVSERATAHNNFAIAYLLRGGRGLPRDVDLHKMLDLYFSCCSIEMTASMLSVAAATLANGGVCPLNGLQVLPTEVVKKTLAVMQCAGMYDNAGVFTLEVGLPAKSGVAGSVMVVVPNLMGFATFSPRLDSFGNSVRGVAFCRELVDRFTFHVYDSLSGGRTGCKQDPRESQHNRKKRDLSDLRWALAYGDRYAIKVRDLTLTCMIDICLADGEIEAPELVTMADTYSEIIGSAIEPAELEALAQSRQVEASAPGAPPPFEDLVARLCREQVQLDDNARELILEAAFRVACADGEIEPEEHGRLVAIAEALAINPGVLELEIDRFRRRLAAA
jgi:glutaminase